MTAYSLWLGNIEIPQTFVKISQDYERLSNFENTRTANGSMFRRTNWSGKLKTTINISGVSASALDGINFDQSMQIKCVAPVGMTAQAGAYVFTLPTARRSDAAPYGMAYNGGQWVQAATDTLVGDTLTLIPVAGATIYKAFYYPQFTAFFDYPNETHSEGVLSDWVLTGEEI